MTDKDWIAVADDLAVEDLGQLLQFDSADHACVRGYHIGYDDFISPSVPNFSNVLNESPSDLGLPPLEQLEALSVSDAPSALAIASHSCPSSSATSSLASTVTQVSTATISRTTKK